MTSAPFRSSKLGHAEWALAAAFLLALVAVGATVVGTFRELDRADAAYAEASFRLTTTANIQRDALLLIHLVDHADEDVFIRRATLERQLDILEGRLPHGGEAGTVVASLRSQLAGFDRLLSAHGLTAPDVHDSLHELDLTTKQLYDRLEVPFFALQRDAAERRRNAQLWLSAGSGGLLAAGAALALTLRRRYRLAFGEAYAGLSEYNAALQALNADILSASRAKDDFIATLSHELRTPLTVINGMAETLQRSWTRLTDAQRHTLIDGIRRNGDRQKRLIDDLMTMAGVVSGRIPVKPAAVALRDVVLEARRDAGAGPEVRIDPSVDDATAFVDPEHLHQILVNLLTNARKYGAAPIEVSARMDDDRLHVVVRDHGPGIPPSFRPALFERFTQAEETDRRTNGGLGLGLAIVKGLVELNGGSVHCEDVEVGASFVVTTPRVVVLPPAPQLLSRR
ncbi:MAG: HAMP domain-containing histidine kinase [Actinobacteria bacterium]|nr:HAMP domain-containing histidine kinase [Actinomycetota bacterium]